MGKGAADGAQGNRPTSVEWKPSSDARRQRTDVTTDDGEFDRQIDILVQRGYPHAAGVKTMEFMTHVDPLQERLGDLAAPDEQTDEGRFPFVIVIKNDLVAEAQAIQRVARRGKTGFSVMDADGLKRFEPIRGVRLPSALAYLLVDIETGKDTLNVAPDEALKIIESRRRSPLTIDEGVALITHYPEAVAKNGGFSLLASRCGDRRVTALWISGGRPKLGWCWAGNPHTWLGSASCGSRVGPRPSDAAA